MIVYCLITLLPGANDTPTIPFKAAAPTTLANEDVVELSCTRYSAPDWKARLPDTVMNVPGVPPPGAKLPRFAIVVLPTKPLPFNVPLAFTVVRLDEAMEPSTCRMP